MATASCGKWRQRCRDGREREKMPSEAGLCFEGGFDHGLRLPTGRVSLRNGLRPSARLMRLDAPALSRRRL